MRARPAGFVNHSVMGAQVGLIGWLFIVSSLAMPAWNAGALGSVPWSFWALAVTGLAVSIAAGLALCEGVLFVQILGAVLSFLASWLTSSDDGKSFPPPAVLAAGMAPAFVSFVWDLASSLRRR